MQLFVVATKRKAISRKPMMQNKTTTNRTRYLHMRSGLVRPKPSAREGFTLTELLVVISIIAILASLLLPAVSRAIAKAQGVRCLSNLKQLQLSCLLYTDDNDGRLPPNNTTIMAGKLTGKPGSWVLGNAQSDLSSSNIEKGVIFRYNGSTAIYHCPADKSTVEGHKELQRLRSYSLDWYLGVDPTVYFSPRIKLRYSEIVTPGPSQVYAFIDEDPSIDDGTFWCPFEHAPDWGNLPAVRHGLGSNLSFADGHVEHWRWRSPKEIGNVSDQEDLHRLWLASPFSPFRSPN
ncbi:MAG: xcpT 2 [Verrucomicrobiales bacterium]|nr:xcpT 2 [Verrucomicrobiales bacterium]